MGQQGPARLDLRIGCFTMQCPHDEQLADGFVGLAIQGQRLKLNLSLAPFPPKEYRLMIYSESQTSQFGQGTAAMIGF